GEAPAGRQGHAGAEGGRGPLPVRLLQGGGRGLGRRGPREDDRGDHRAAHPRRGLWGVPEVLRSGRSRPRAGRDLHGGQVMTRFLRAIALVLLVGSATTTAACGGASPSAHTTLDIQKRRSGARGSNDG